MSSVKPLNRTFKAIYVLLTKKHLLTLFLHNFMFYVQNASRAHFDFARLARVFFVPEHVNMEQAVELVKKPRYSKWDKQ